MTVGRGAEVLLRLLLSLQISYSEHSAVFKGYVLDADEFPTILAQNVEVILNVLYGWLATAFITVSMNARFYRNDFVFPQRHENKIRQLLQS